MFVSASWRGCAHSECGCVISMCVFGCMFVWVFFLLFISYFMSVWDVQIILILLIQVFLDPLSHCRALFSSLYCMFHIPLMPEGILWGFGRETELGQEHLKLIFTTQEINWLLLSQEFTDLCILKGRIVTVQKTINTQSLYYAGPDTKVPEHY